MQNRQNRQNRQWDTLRQASGPLSFCLLFACSACFARFACSLAGAALGMMLPDGGGGGRLIMQKKLENEFCMNLQNQKFIFNFCFRFLPWMEQDTLRFGSISVTWDSVGFSSGVAFSQSHPPPPVAWPFPALPFRPLSETDSQNDSWYEN